MSKLVAYRRVSTTNKSQKTDRQLYDMGFTFDLEFEDHSSGSKREGRPQLDKCLATLEKGDTLYIHSIDRLCRNTSDLLNITKDLIAREIGIKFVKEGLNIGMKDDPMGAAMSQVLLSVLGSIHEFQLTMIKTSVKEGLKVAVANGKKLGAASPIYKANKIAGKHKPHVSSGNQQAAVNRVIHLKQTLVSCISSHKNVANKAPTLRELAKTLTDMGTPLPSGQMKSWQPIQVSRVMTKLSLTM